jgi:hypothetical protein
LKFVIHFVVAVAIIFGGGSLLFWAFDSNTPKWLEITAFVVIFILANIAGFFIKEMEALGISIIAGAAGCSLGFSVCAAAQI